MNDDGLCCAITPDGICDADGIYLVKHDEMEYRLCAYHRQLFGSRGELRVSTPSQPAHHERAGHANSRSRRS